jgi:prepilin-type N-terminal cleavage/methylation domain-containing protein
VSGTPVALVTVSRTSSFAASQSTVRRRTVILEHQNTMKNMRKGFTLIELLIVVVIIGILAAIAIPKFANTKSKAYIAAMKSDLRNLVTAEEAYFADSAKYATDTSKGMKFKSSTGVSMPTIAVFSGSWLATNTHSQLANFSCGIGVNTTNPLVTAAGDGEPSCQ